jgi:hypothetical protein
MKTPSGQGSRDSCFGLYTIKALEVARKQIESQNDDEDDDNNNDRKTWST